MTSHHDLATFADLAPITDTADHVYARTATDPQTCQVWVLHVPTRGALAHVDVFSALRRVLIADTKGLAAKHLTGEYLAGYSFAEWGEPKATAAPTDIGHLAIYFSASPAEADERGRAIRDCLPEEFIADSRYALNPPHG